ncbi:acid protease [Mollisia scopiformis]|uniref:Acid protease n=1 Tax=Mollisia scopiformis TaxID=149040 RepID=A0A194X747_MOLSC|nr:acid protease [Mollisia scopiformis]KUJ15996.1 acid protease [Mollisia scopiformis]
MIWSCVIVQLTLACMSQGLGRRATVLPAPVVVSPSQFFEGSDGPWSSFELRIGSPSQNVRFFPGSSSTSTVVVVPEGCQNEGSDCASTRGGIFTPNSSTSWSSIGSYGLEFEQSLGYSDSAEFGFDSVGLGYQGSGGPTVNHSVVAGVAGSYTAGALYRLKQVLGSLTLGGYDSSRFAALNSNLSFGFGSDQTRDLTVGLQSITTNATGNDIELLASGINIFIDTSVAQLYLPSAACQAFELAFGLTYNTTVGLYLINETLHNLLVSQNPIVSFTIGNTASGGPTTSITLPYASFDLQATYPLVDGNSSRYFPLQRAANETQYTLGRIFMQEAYLTVDYERGNFSVSPCVWDANFGEHIITIFSSNTTLSNGTSLGGTISVTGFGGGAIAGAVIGSLICVALIAGGFWYFIIRPRASHNISQEEDLDSRKEGAAEVGGTEKPIVGEVEGQNEFTHHEAEGDSAFNMEKSTFGKAELHSPGEISELRSPMSETSELMGTPIHEMPGSDVPEMMAA